MLRIAAFSLVLLSFVFVLAACEVSDTRSNQNAATAEESEPQRTRVTTLGDRDRRPEAEREEAARRDTTWRAHRNGAAGEGARREATRRDEVSDDVLDRYADELAVPLGDDADGRAVFYAQVLLDRAGFSPGQIDNYWGQNTEKAIYWFQRSSGLDSTGTLDRETLHELIRVADAPDEPEDLVTDYSVTADDVEGPFQPIPEDEAEQAEMDRLGYESLGEKLGERFHTSADMLGRLNDGMSIDNLSAGQTIRVPDVRDARPSFSGTTDRIIISDGGRYLHVLDGEGNIAFHFPATLGAEYDPSPRETLEVDGIAHEPEWHYQPEILARVDDDEDDLFIPPGPNNPVGMVWINLTKEHYGIHGTDAPGAIGHTSSAGCVRLTNWDVQFLADIVQDGTAVEFRDADGREEQGSDEA
jgi:lipoprotein-anchoring transpeptidase ErfK/SrfK